MSSIKEAIKAEIERIINEETPVSKGADYYHGVKESMEILLSFIDSLPEEKPSEDLEEAADEYAISLTPCDQQEELNYFNSFIAGAEWMRSQMPMPEDTVIFMKGVEEGRGLEREDSKLTWKDIRKIVQIADRMLDDPKARVEYQNHNEEYYYKRVLNEYELHKTQAE